LAPAALIQRRIDALRGRGTRPSDPPKFLNKIVHFRMRPGGAVIPEIEQCILVARHPVDNLRRPLADDPEGQAVGDDVGLSATATSPPGKLASAGAQILDRLVAAEEVEEDTQRVAALAFEVRVMLEHQPGIVMGDGNQLLMGREIGQPQAR
jgi:hypothetical protein